MKHLRQLIKYAEAAYDLEIMKKTYYLAALAAQTFNNYTKAIEMFKHLWDVCAEDQDNKMKLLAYKSMGSCYQ